MVSTVRLDALIAAIERIRLGSSDESKTLMTISWEEHLDILRDAKRWREHVRAPKNCDHRLDR